MSSFDIKWKSKEVASPWKRVVSFLIDIVILLPPVLMVARSHNYNPLPSASLSNWILFSLWGWYTFLFGIGLPLYKGMCSVGDAVMKLGVTDLQGNRISKLKLMARQLTCCFLLLWMLLPSFIYAGIIVNIIFYSSVFFKDKEYKLYMHAVDRLFKTTVMTVEFEKKGK
jgi:uncharacterized RDD family membrane protein YckC